jgi:outer membrane protein assembly factor BamB
MATAAHWYTLFYLTSSNGIDDVSCNDVVSIIAPIFSSPAIINDRLMFGSVDGNVHCLSCDNGDTHWRYQSSTMVGYSVHTSILHVTWMNEDKQGAPIEQ